MVCTLWSVESMNELLLIVNTDIYVYIFFYINDPNNIKSGRGVCCRESGFQIIFNNACRIGKG